MIDSINDTLNANASALFPTVKQPHKGCGNDAEAFSFAKEPK